MAKSKLDLFFSVASARDKKTVLQTLNDGSIPHTEIPALLQDFLTVSEASVRRWRSCQGVSLLPKTEDEAPAPKVLIWDIESSPVLGYVWGMYEQNVLHVVRDWKLLTVSWTWFGSGEYHAKQICDFGGYKKGELNDEPLALFVRNLLNEADYAVAHNGNAFDVKKVNAKFAEYSFTPPSPFTPIDTLMVARRNMKMSSNKLDSLGTTLGVGRKFKHSGFDLWLRCMAGEPDAWEEMREYAIQDVILLESVFERLMPWIKGLSYGHFTTGFVCSNCGSNDLVQEGQYKTTTNTVPAWNCQECGTWNKKPRGIK